MTDRLTDSEIGERMAAVPDWARVEDAICRTIRFDTFADGIEFICRVAPSQTRRTIIPTSILGTAT